MTLKIPKIRVFTSEKVAAQNHATATVNVNMPAYPDPVDPYPESKAPVLTPASGVVQERDINLEYNTNSEKILKALLDAYMTNPLHVNDVVVLRPEQLSELVQQATDADQVELTYSDDITCCGPASKFMVVESIVVVKDGKRNDLEISYNDEYRFLKDYRISTNLIYNA